VNRSSAGFPSGPSGFCLAAETGYPGSVIFGEVLGPKDQEVVDSIKQGDMIKKIVIS
jgi:hypothetical protein